MTRKEKEKIMLDALGVKVGDIVIIDNDEYKVEEEEKYYILINNIVKRGVSGLLTNAYKIVIPKKKKGELICENMLCRSCPLQALNCNCDDVKRNLYKQLEYLKEVMPCKAYEEYKKVLDEEIEESKK